jgi:hypothetical protein
MEDRYLSTLEDGLDGPTGFRAAAQTPSTLETKIAEIAHAPGLPQKYIDQSAKVGYRVALIGGDRSMSSEEIASFLEEIGKYAFWAYCDDNGEQPELRADTVFEQGGVFTHR